MQALLQYVWLLHGNLAVQVSVPTDFEHGAGAQIFSEPEKKDDNLMPFMISIQPVPLGWFLPGKYPSFLSPVVTHRNKLQAGHKSFI